MKTETILFCVRVEAIHDCWISDLEGSLGRCRLKENAKTFLSKQEAEFLCEKMKAKYPSRNVWVAEY